jgi:hypothetical protein
MKKPLLITLGWTMLFIALSVFFMDWGVLGYSGGEWTMYFGYPDWLYVHGMGGGYPGFWKGLWNGAWRWSASRFLAAAAIAWLPIALIIVSFLIAKRQFRFHLISAIAMVFAAGGMVAANFSKLSANGAWGWPLRNDDYVAPSIIILSDISVAVAVVFFVGLLCEFWQRRIERKAADKK